MPMAAAQQKMMELQMAAETKRRAQDEATRGERERNDSVALAQYVAEHPELAKATRTPSGVYVLITQPGTGPKPAAGQTVAVSYRGTLLDGKEFDTSNRGGKDQPYEYPYGQGQVIPGWDEGVGMLNKGAKATILVPSTLGYGSAGSPPRIAPNSPLRFDVQLQSISGPAAANTPPTPAPSASAR
jgi:FKBP-type peptidyl-prolyl cis-trans isomerase FkpA